MVSHKETYKSTSNHSHAIFSFWMEECPVASQMKRTTHHHASHTCTRGSAIQNSFEHCPQMLFTTMKIKDVTF